MRGSAPVVVFLLAAGAAQAGELSVRGNLDWITAARGTLARDAAPNAENRVFRLPTGLLSSELRPNVRVGFGDSLDLVLRPRFLAEVTKARVGEDWWGEQSNAAMEWIELFATWRPDPSVSVTYGIQNFQWGPTELLGPSNRLFHQPGLTRDPLFVTEGRHLVRVNASAGRAWSAVALLEVADNGVRPFVAGEPFAPRGLLKAEYLSDSGAHYVGVVVGGGAGERPWFGEYAQVTPLENLTLYVDASHGRGSRAWYPKELPPFGVPVFERDRLGSRWLRTLAVGGARYDFDGGAELRGEFVWNDAGWTADELRLAQRAASVVAPGEEGAGAGPVWLAPYLAPGLEFLGRRLAYASLRVPDLPPGKRLQLSLRYLHSLTDNSGAGFLTASFDASDTTVIFLSLLATRGSEFGEFARTVRGTLTLAAVRSW